MADLAYPFTICRWSYINPQTKRRRATRYRLTEAEARKAFGDSVERVTGSELVIDGPSTDFGAWSQK